MKADDPAEEGLLSRLGLHRPELRAWALYDWANSAMVTTVVTAVFPIYFTAVAAAGAAPAQATRSFALATTAGLFVVALLAPFLGTLADVRPMKKRMLSGFLAVGVVSTAALFLVERGDWLLGAILFVLGNVGLNGTFVFYDALLPHVARGDELDRVSTSAYAIGYLGGGLLLALNLAWIQRPAWFGMPSGPDLSPQAATLPTRMAFLSVAAWWLLFSLPLFLRVREPPVRGGSYAGSISRLTVERLGRTLRSLREHRQALLMLLAYLIYNDGIGTIIRMATAYGTELGIGRGALIGAVLMVQFVGVPAALLFGAVAVRLGAKVGIIVGLVTYAAVTVVAFFMRTAVHFFVLAFLVALVQGGTQALSRSVFASMVPRHQSGEFFGFFSATEKVAGILGPGVFALAITLVGSSRAAVLSILGFFALGAILLLRVDVEAGRRAARAAEGAPPGPAAGG